MLSNRRPGAPWWHDLTDQRPLGTVLFAGLAATVMAVLTGYLLPAINLPTVAWPLTQGELHAPYSQFGTAGQVALGLVVVLLTGVLLAFLYGLFVQPSIAHTRPMTQVGVGLVAGLVLAFIELLLLLPLVYAPDRGYGAFMASGPDGWLLPLSVAVVMLVYGGLLTVLYQPRPLSSVAQPAPTTPTR